MKIGFDITELYVAQAGVFYYRFNLLRALLQLEPQEQSYRLIDYFPIHGGWLERPEVDTLVSPHAETRHVQGLRHRKLARLWFLQKPGLIQMAQVIDSVLLDPWGKRARAVLEEKLTLELQGVDIFHSSDVLNFAPPGVKTVTTIHDMTTLLFPEHHTRETILLQQEKFRFAREQADAIISVSESTKRDIIRLLGIEPERIHVVHEGVDPVFCPLLGEDISPVLAKYELQPDDYILTVGTIEPRKNLVRLVRAYDVVWQKQPESTPRLVLAGTTGWFFREVFAEIEKLGLAEQVLFIGRVDDADLPALYNGALFLAYPTLYEGFGLPALEAMACGTAVLTSNVSSLPEVVGGAGLLVEPDDTQSIVEGLVKMLEDVSLRQEKSRLGLVRAKEFTWQRAAEETTAVYKKIINLGE
jgi:glycosyltransferase involved in cell wall biosynthesis